MEGDYAPASKHPQFALMHTLISSRECRQRKSLVRSDL
jgi:hypothetical protein